VKERSGNVYENKGPVWKKWERSGNVAENKGTYRFKAGMYLKTQQLMLSYQIKLQQAQTQSPRQNHPSEQVTSDRTAEFNPQLGRPGDGLGHHHPLPPPAWLAGVLSTE
jgi:hypothetical protein